MLNLLALYRHHRRDLAELFAFFFPRQHAERLLESFVKVAVVNTFDTRVVQPFDQMIVAYRWLQNAMVRSIPTYALYRSVHTDATALRATGRAHHAAACADRRATGCGTLAATGRRGGAVRPDGPGARRGRHAAAPRRPAPGTRHLAATPTGRSADQRVTHRRVLGAHQRQRLCAAEADGHGGEWAANRG